MPNSLYTLYKCTVLSNPLVTPVNYRILTDLISRVIMDDRIDDRFEY